MPPNSFYLYIVASRTRVLYLGITRNLKRRLLAHKTGEIPGFATKNRCNRLVWFEKHPTPERAIEREEHLRKWTRARKIALIERENPSWADWGEDLASAMKKAASKMHVKTHRPRKSS